MKQHILTALLLSAGLCLSGCTGQTNTPPAPEKSPVEDNFPKQNLAMLIDGTTVEVHWEDNDTVSELLAYMQNLPIIVDTSAYGGFEQVGSLPQSFTRSDVQITTQPGDIVLYSGNQLVVFFGANSWNYTKLGHIDGLSADELTTLLGKNSTTVEIYCS